MYWFVTLAALTEIGIAWAMDYAPKGSQSAELAFLTHIALGVVLAVLVIVVPIWRFFARSPDDPATGRHWLRIALRVSRLLLLLLVLMAALTGYLAWSFGGGSEPSWAQWLPGSVPVGPHTGVMLGRWHAISAIAVMFPILSTLLLMAWSALKGHGGSTQRRRVLMSPEPPPAPTPDNESATRPEQELLAKGRGLARHLKIFGAIAFWTQLCLGLVAALLLFVTSSSRYYEDSLQSLPGGLSWAEGTLWAYLSLGVLALTTLGFYSVVVRARSLKRGEAPDNGGASVKRLISKINLGSALGLTLAIFGNALSIALLISKTVSQPPGIAITNPQAIVRAVDVFVLLANFDIVVAHFIGILICLWILNRVNNFYWWARPARA